jgi:hypothetical protein
MKILKSEGLIEAELLRMAEVFAKEAGESLSHPEIRVIPLREPNEYGVHWYVNFVWAADKAFVERAIADVSKRGWDVEV